MRGHVSLGIAAVLSLCLVSCGGGNGGIALPAGWQEVSYQGIAVDVPGTWPVYPPTGPFPCPFLGPGVQVAPTGRADVRPCHRPFQLEHTILEFGRLGSVGPVAPEHHKRVHGITILFASAVHDLSGSPLTTGPGTPRFECSVTVRFPTKRDVWLLFVEPNDQEAGACDLSDQVVTTIHPA